MQHDSELVHPTLSDADIAQLRSALSMKYSVASGVLGAQLGAIIRETLPALNLRVHFGGLKPFLARYFPSEIVWAGNRGLDDIYDVRFGETEISSAGTWDTVPPTATPALWSAVTNPAILVQFAWSQADGQLYRATKGLGCPEALTPVPKLDRADYESIARSFVENSRLDDTTREELARLVESFQEFTKSVRDRGLAARWEEFRVDSALRVFTERLANAGARPEAVTRWTEILRLSRQQAWADRLRATPPVPRPRRSTVVARTIAVNRASPTLRDIAIATIGFLSEAELASISVPLGAVVRAFERFGAD